MRYVKTSPRDSRPVMAPMLLALGSMGLLAIVLRRARAPRSELRLKLAAGSRDEQDTEQEPIDASDGFPASAGTQPSSTGCGMLIHRQYEVVLPTLTLRATDLVRLMQRHLTELSPASLAEFEKCEGSEMVFQVGDEYDITMLGPWNGRVRVSEMSDDAFTLVTLEGHPEAGRITFSAHDHSGGERAALVRIESWARARDSVVDAAYSTIGIGKQIQTEVWITFLQRLSALAGVVDTPQVRITTEELAGDPEPETEETVTRDA